MYKDKRRQILMDAYTAMISRCERPSSISYPNYGGRGIKVCERWRNSFDAFVSDMGFRPEGRSLDRINNDGDYCPENVRWATKEQQAANKRTTILITIDGETNPLSVWCKKFGISPQAAFHRIRKLNLDPVWSVTTPASRKARYQINWGSSIK